MAEPKKTSASLEGKEVEIFLTTPLFRFRYLEGKNEKELLENAVRISGIVKSERPGGLVLDVDVISNLKKKENNLPFERIFLPFTKIDFVILR